MTNRNSKLGKAVMATQMICRLGKEKEEESMGQGMGERAWTKKRKHGQSMVGGGHLCGSLGYGEPAGGGEAFQNRVEESRTGEGQSSAQHCWDGLCWAKLG
jgi:hypothetical protein